MAGQKVKVEKDNSERWLLTYADLMNLLLILFIILFAMSQVDRAKYDQLAASLKAALGDSSAASFIGTTGTSNSLIPLEANASSSVIPTRLEEQQMEAVREKVNELIQKGNLKGQVDVVLEERGIVISMTAQLLFKSGSAQIEPSASKTIEDIGKVLLSIPGNQIKVEGHTDTDPINTSQFPSNWELSSSRATNVLRLLVDRVGINPKLISSVGYGEFRPKLPNTSEQNKTANRRVNIVIVKSLYDKAEAGISKPVNQTAASGQTSPSGQAASNTGSNLSEEKIVVDLNDYIPSSNEDTSSGETQVLDKIREIIKNKPTVKIISIKWNVVRDSVISPQAVIFDLKNKVLQRYMKMPGDEQWARYTYINITVDSIKNAKSIGSDFKEGRYSKVDAIDTK